LIFSFDVMRCWLMRSQQELVFSILGMDWLGWCGCRQGWLCDSQLARTMEYEGLGVCAASNWTSVSWMVIDCHMVPWIVHWPPQVQRIYSFAEPRAKQAKARGWCSMTTPDEPWKEG
jgi:hypothetical protein